MKIYKPTNKTIPMNHVKYLLFAFVLHIACYGQQMPNVVPPSPEAASVFKFTEVPVSLYTGVPNISIPLFEIESGGVTVPISISYHARGIKVAEIASRVGLGWTLNCGGIMSRQIRDEADDYPGVESVDFNGIFDNQAKRLEEYNNFSIMDTPPFKINCLPDQYYFNVNGISGKYIRDYTDGGILMQQFSNVKFTSDGITDSRGNSYTFEGTGDTERSGRSWELREIIGHYVISPDGGDPVFANTWHLSRIKTQKGPEITFDYLPEQSYYYRRSYDKYDPSSSPRQYKSYVSEVFSTQQRLSQVNFDKGIVVFEYEIRDDISGGTRLKSIRLKDKNETIIKQVDFTYEYVFATDNINTHTYLKSFDLPAKKRLYLKTVQIKNGTQSLPPYTFDYNSIPLPNRHSNSQDIWGYYNGKDNGPCLKNPDETNTVGGRTVDTIMAAAGMLEKIIYPEGGYTRFHYEHNRVFSHFPKDVFFGDPNPYTSNYAGITSIEYNNSAFPGVYSQGVYRKTFTIPESMVGIPSYMVDIDDPRGCSYPSNTGQCRFDIRVYNNSVSYSLLQTGDSQRRNISALGPGNYTLEVTPKNGRLHDPSDDPSHSNLFDPQGYPVDVESFRVNIKWLQTIPNNEPMYAGGKRIKKIEYYDSENHLGLTKTYDYNNPATGNSSGLLLGLPNFRSIERRIATIGGEEFTIYGWTGNVPGSVLSTYQEQSVGYGTVTEYNGQGGNTLGKTVNKFTMTEDTGEYWTYPYHPPTDNEWLRGKELSVTTYKSNPDGSYSPVKRTDNEYIYAGGTGFFNGAAYRKPIEEGLEDCPLPGSGQPIELYCGISSYLKNSRIWRLPLALFYDGNYGQTTANNTPIKMYKAYQLTGGTMDLRKTTSTDYLDNGGEFITTTDYTYDYDNHYNVAEETSSTSDGTVTNKYFYPQDPEMLGRPHAADLARKNINVPLVSQSYRGNDKLSELETVYRKWNDTLLAPEYIRAAKGTADTLTRIRYVKIDDTNGNVLQVKKESGIDITYLWGYNGQYPIAMIENANLATVLAALGTTEAAVKQWFTTPSNIRTLLPNAMVTTYGYRPLVGVASVTDPKGYSLYYTYDSFGRLEFVKEKDPDNNYRILSETKYHYRQE